MRTFEQQDAIWLLKQAFLTPAHHLTTPFPQGVMKTIEAFITSLDMFSIYLTPEHPNAH